MRTILARMKLVSVLLCALVCAFSACALWRLPVFEGGRSYEFYLGDSSAAILPSSDPVLDKLLLSHVKGESVRYEGDRYDDLKTSFHARLLFTEEAAGVTNYYLYSPLLEGGVSLNGEKVNLHIAVSGERTAAGTPLIFGGF